MKEFCQLLRNAYFKKRILMAASAIYFFNLFLLSCKRVSKAVRKFPNILPKTSRLFVSPHHDHGDIMHDQAYNLAFHQKLQSFQCNVSLAITGTIRATSTEKPHEELGLKSLQLRTWYEELCCFVCCKVKDNFFENSCD